MKPCRDCGDPSPGRRPRPAPYPGPRCATHHRIEQRRRRLAASARHVERTYGLTADEYDRLFEIQGRRCAICRRATGATKRLAVDHDHRLARDHDHPYERGCPLCVRGLLCGPCNDVVAHARDEPEYFRRAIRYLAEWPSVAL
jgi:Recombination endonuclease VII